MRWRGYWTDWPTGSVFNCRNPPGSDPNYNHRTGLAFRITHAFMSIFKMWAIWRFCAVLQVAQERHELEYKRRQFFLDEIKDMTSTLKDLRSANPPSLQPKNSHMTRLQERSTAHSHDYTKREFMLQNSDYPPPAYHKPSTPAQPQYALPPYPPSLNTMLPAHHSQQSPATASRSNASIFTPRAYHQRY